MDQGEEIYEHLCQRSIDIISDGDILTKRVLLPMSITPTDQRVGILV